MQPTASRVWLDSSYAAISMPTPANYPLKFKTLYPETLMVKMWWGAVALSIALVLLFVFYIAFIYVPVQIAFYEVAATATILQCQNVPPIGKTGPGMRFNLSYPLQDGTGKLIEVSSIAYSGVLQPHNCSEFQTGTSLQIKYSPDQPSHVDIVDSKLAEPWLPFVLLYSVPFGTAVFAVICAGYELRGAILFFQKRKHWYMLRRQGVIREGEIVSCETRGVSRSNGVLRLIVYYKFLTAEGIGQSGQQLAEYIDTEQPLLEPGTPITVLYANHHVHCVL